MFIHWGLYAIPGGEWKGTVRATGYSEWVMFDDRIPPPHCDYITSSDNEIFDKPIGFEWENPGSMNTSFGFNKNDCLGPVMLRTGNPAKRCLAASVA